MEELSPQFVLFAQFFLLNLRLVPVYHTSPADKSANNLVVVVEKGRHFGGSVSRMKSSDNKGRRKTLEGQKKSLNCEPITMLRNIASIYRRICREGTKNAK